MAALPQDMMTDLTRTVADLQQRIQAISAERDEAVAQQSATTEVFQVINSSPANLAPVFDAILERAMRLCEAPIGVLWTYDGEYMRASASRGAPPAYAEFLERGPIRPSHIQLQLLDRSDGFVQVADIALTEGYRIGDPLPRAAADLGGIRTLLVVPLRKHGVLLGTFGIYRQEVRPFSDRQVALVQSFAVQAVIAMENARLFNETKEALERQTATADILKVIASSPSEVHPVFAAIANSANRLIGGFSTAVFSIFDEMVHLTAFTPTNPAADAAMKATFPRPLSSQVWGDQIRNGQIVHILDTEIEWAEQPSLRDMASMRGFRSIIFVPLLRDRATIGMIAVSRAAPGTFAAHHVQLLQTFADQAVIAIENARLFQQLQKRTRELSASLDDLRTAQDRLVQTEKLASLGQLTAGIAHEIKNPLNFVNNFSALSAELIVELDETLAPAPLDQKMRGDVGELTQMLKSNLEKVVQHGKRADSIVKNMLLHSREGSGEHRSVDINALVEESLNLAYHGARAEKPGFNVTMKRDLDPDAGAVELYPQEITRALLNLISNGFYAATQRKSIEEETFEPVLIAATKNLDKTVEIRIRDNGTGIPQEVKEKIFNPFFTTKPSGEGTGLGLSMSHDIIVKQHGGSIDVETEPGRFTEFKIVLPRTNRR